MALNSKFSVRKFVVGLKEKFMHTSYGETSGFVPVATDEQAAVNGGWICYRDPIRELIATLTLVSKSGGK
jgi:hypothetical protein